MIFLLVSSDDNNLIRCVTKHSSTNARSDQISQILTVLLKKFDIVNRKRSLSVRNIENYYMTQTPVTDVRARARMSVHLSYREGRKSGNGSRIQAKYIIL